MTQSKTREGKYQITHGSWKSFTLFLCISRSIYTHQTHHLDTGVAVGVDNDDAPSSASPQPPLSLDRKLRLPPRRSPLSKDSGGDPTSDSDDESERRVEADEEASLSRSEMRKSARGSAAGSADASPTLRGLL